MGLLDLFGHKYPFTDFHELNLDWCITAILQLQKAFEDFSAGNKLIFANPLQHDLTKTYAKNTIVVDSVSGTAYLSLDAVPVGVQLTNADYWLPVFDFAGYVTRANQNFTDNYFSGTDRTPIALAVGDWVVLDDVLYKVAVAMAADDLFIIGTNIVHFTVEQFLKDFITSVNNTLAAYSLTIQQYKNDIDASELAYRQQLAQDIADTTASLQAQLDAAISGATVDSEVINARVGFDGTTYPTLGDAIRSQVGILDTMHKMTDLLSTVFPAVWEQGSLDASTGVPTVSANRIRTQFIDVNSYTEALVSADNAYKFVMFFYDSSKTFISMDSWQGNTYPYKFASTVKYIKIVGGLKTDASIVPTDASNYVIKLFSPLHDTVEGDHNDITAVSNAALQPIIIAWEQGSFDTGTGGTVPSTNRIRTDFIKADTYDLFNFRVNGFYKYMLFYYDSSKTYIGHGEWCDIDTRLKFFDGYIRILYGRTDNRNCGIDIGAYFECDKAADLQYYEPDLTWEQGAFDSSGGKVDSNNRIRTPFIDCSKFKKIRFSPTNGYKFMIWFYDSSKSFITRGEWRYTPYELTDLSGYIKIMFGTNANADLTPSSGTELKIEGVVPATITMIDDDNAIKCIKKRELIDNEIAITSYWEYGGIASDTGLDNGSSTNRLRTSDFIDLNGYKKIKFQIDQGYRYVAYFYDSSQTFIADEYVTTDWQVYDRIIDVDVDNIRYMRIALSNTADTTLNLYDNDHIKIFDVSDLEFATIQQKSMEDGDLVIMTYNCQGFTGRNSELELIRSFIDKYQPDIIGLQEYYPTDSDSKTFYKRVLSEYNYRLEWTDYAIGNALFSKLELTDKTNITLSPSIEPRNCNKAYIEVLGIKIALYNTHLESGTAFPYTDGSPYRIAEMEQIKADADQEEYAIIMGDLNTIMGIDDTGADYIGIVKPFVDEGWHVANCSHQHGFIKTYYNGDSVALSTYIFCLDNVITTSNIDILKVTADRSKAMTVGNPIDHLPVIVHLHVN